MNEATKTTAWLKALRNKYPDSFIWKIPDDSNREKPIDVIVVSHGFTFFIEFKYNKKDLSIPRALKLLQLNQMLTIKKIHSQGCFGLLGLFTPTDLFYYFYNSHVDKRFKIGQDTMISGINGFGDGEAQGKDQQTGVRKESRIRGILYPDQKEEV